MRSNRKIQAYVFLFLAFCVLSSKSVIIYNEETLVALSFLTFVLFCIHYFANTVKESLDERGLHIKEEFENFVRSKEESLKELFQEHKRISQVKDVLPSIGALTEQQLSHYTQSGKQALSSLFAQQFAHKLNSLSAMKGTLQQRLQLYIAKNVESLVLIEMRKLLKSGQKKDQLNTKAIKRGIQSLRKNV